MKSGKCFLAMVVTGILFMGLLMWSGIVQAEVNKHVFHIGLVHSKTHILHRTAETLKGMLAKRSGGKINLIIHYAGEMGNEPEMTRMLQAGTLDFTITNTISFDSFTPVFGALNLPFLFPDKEALQSFEREILIPNRYPKVIEGAGVIPLGLYSSGWRYMFARKETNKPEDFKGLKKRVMQSPYHIEAWKSLGVIPTPLPWGEVYTALQLGTVDLGANEFPTYVLSKFYETAPYIVTTKHTQTPMLLIFSKKIYDRLTPEEQTIIKESGKEAMEYWWGKLEEYEQESMDQLKKIPGYGKKFRVIEFTDAQRAEMRNIALPVLFDKYLPQLGVDAVQWFKKRGYVDPYMNKLSGPTKAWLKENVK